MKLTNFSPPETGFKFKKLSIFAHFNADALWKSIFTSFNRIGPRELDLDRRGRAIAPGKKLETARWRPWATLWAIKKNDIPFVHRKGLH